MRHTAPFLAAPFLASMAALLLLAPVARGEAVDAGDVLLAEIVEARKAANVSALTEALGRVPDIYKATENSGLQGKLRAEMGKVLKDEDMGPARKAALEALTQLEDPKNAWKVVAKQLPDRKMEEPKEFDLAVVRSAGAFAQARAIKPLLELAGKAKNPTISKAAVQALSGYGADTRNRVSIFEELVDVAKKARPGRSMEKAVSPEAQERWGLLEPGIVAALNRLTGQSLSSFEEWEAMAKEYKRNLKDLFPSGD